MTLSIFGLVFGIAGAGIILLLLFLFFKFKNSIKRKYKKDISQFKNGYMHQSFSVSTTLTVSKKKQILKYLSDYNLEHVVGNNGEMILYLNDFKKAFLHGTLSVPWKEIALRIVIEQKGFEVNVSMDDDYGIKKAGYEKRVTDEIKKDFMAKCNQAFEFHEEQLRKIIS